MGRLLAASLVLALAACAEPETPLCFGAPENTLRGVIDADNARDLSRAVSAYADDVIWLGPSGEVRGADAVRQRYAELYREYAPDLRIAVDGVRRQGGAATVWGRTSGQLEARTLGEPSRVVDDVFLAAVQCQGGRWTIGAMMWHPRPR